MGTDDNTKKDPKLLENRSRRKAVKTIAGGVTALAAYHTFPVNWSKPIIEQVFIPAHAATSGSGLLDPCEITLLEGSQDSKSVKFTVTGYVSPPTENLPALIQAYGTPESSEESVETTTNKDGQFKATITLTTTTGISAVHVTTTVEGATGSAKCSIDIPQGESGQPPEESPEEPPEEPDCLSVTFTNVDVPRIPIGIRLESSDCDGAPLAADLLLGSSATWSLPRPPLGITVRASGYVVEYQITDTDGSSTPPTILNPGGILDWPQTLTLTDDAATVTFTNVNGVP